ncbi:galectin-1-like [Lissotriton helveticus]
MAQVVVTRELGLTPGHSVFITGMIKNDINDFHINLGQDFDNLVLHFAPRFKIGSDVNTIVCNSRYQGVWNQEVRDNDFPFQKGQKVQLTVEYRMDELLITLQDNHVIPFPNRLDLKVVNYLSAAGVDIHSFNVQ